MEKEYINLMIAFHEISCRVLHVLLSFGSPLSHNCHKLKEDTRCNQIKTLSLSLGFNVVENIKISDSRHVCCWCMQKILFIYLSPFHFVLPCIAFLLKSLVLLNIFYFFSKIIKWSVSECFDFRTMSVFIGCLQSSEIVLILSWHFCHIAMIFSSSRLIGHQRRMNSMWHKMKLLVTHEFLKHFNSSCMQRYGIWWRVNLFTNWSGNIWWDMA